MIIYNKNPASYTLEMPGCDMSGSHCLITYAPLDDDHIKLECGHEYNYVPFMRNIMTQLKTPRNKSIFRYHIICPYCRNTQHSPLIPFYDKYYGEIPYMYGIHSLDMEMVQMCTDRTFIKTHKQKPSKKAVKIK